MALTKVSGDGLDSAAISTVNSEGGAVTTSVVQGLCKVWINFNASGTIATRDSLNVSSITDEAQGYFQYDFTNAMNNSDYSGSGNAGEGNNNNNRNIEFGDTYSTTALDVNCGDGVGSAVDPSVLCSQIVGDLA